MTGSTWRDRLDELRRSTGCREGHIQGIVEVDQIYAHYQHEHLEFRHPRGGEAMYLTRPLLENFTMYLNDFARTVLEDGGQPAMRRSMEHLSDQVELRAPVEFADLRESGHPQVILGEHVVYNREPKVHRLSEEELRLKSRLRHLPPELLGWIYWHMTARGKAGIPPPRHSRWEG